MRPDTIAAIASAPGEGAVGIVRLSGPGALSMASQICRQPAAFFTPRSMHYTRLIHPQSGETLDEAMTVYFQAPASFTGEDSIEFHCHGNPEILADLVRVLVSIGARPANPGEFTMRAYLNGKLDLPRAEAVNELVRAQSKAARAAALSQLEGKLSTRAEQLYSGVLDLLARLEAAIDHSDIEETFLPAEEIRRSLSKLTEAHEALLSTSAAGRMALRGVRAVLFGSPNAGKSSLMNALLGEDRVIVSEIPGTTRDTVKDSFFHQGVEIHLTDTAGIRETEDQIERQGVERSRRALEAADVGLWVNAHDTETAPELPAELSGKPCFFIQTKTDLSPQPLSTPAECARSFRVSSLKCEGLEELKEALAAVYTSLGTDPAREGLLTNARHEASVRVSLDALHKARQTFENGLSEEFIASDVRKAKSALEDLLGRRGDEEVLDRIFSQFCIGK